MCRLRTVKNALKSGSAVTAALYEAGYSSSSRLYERSGKELGMTPRSYARGGEGQLINYSFISSPLGLLLIAGTKRGLCFLQFGAPHKELTRALKAEFDRAVIVENADALLGRLALTPKLQKQSDVRVLCAQLHVPVHQTKWRWQSLATTLSGKTAAWAAIAGD